MALPEIIQSLSNHSLLICITIILYLIFIYRTMSNYWANRGVISLTPLQSLVHTTRRLLRVDSIVDSYFNLYKTLEGHKFGGTFELSNPQLLLRDPELIKLILTKEFAHFQASNREPDEELDPHSASTFNLRGERWHQVRKRLSRAFSPANLKVMFRVIQDCVQETVSYLETEDAGTGVEVDAQQLMINYGLEVIGLCNLGVKFNSIQNEDTEVKRLALDIFRFNSRRAVFNTLELLHPKLPALLRWKQVRQGVETFFLNTCKEAVDFRKSEATTKIDFLQSLMDAQSAELNKLESKQQIDPSEDSDIVFSDDLIVGIVRAFFSVGARALSSRLSFCLYELALHPEIQEKVFAEIQAVRAGIFDDDIPYEMLNEFKYTKQVIDETTRKYPGGVIIERICTEPFKFPDTSFVIQKDVKITISVYGLHMDPQYFPDPEKFDPDRFSEENQANIVPGTYLPYGAGPRGCVARRFALMNLMAMLIHLVSNFTIRPSARTPMKIVFDPESFAAAPKQKLWLSLQKRVKL